MKWIRFVSICAAILILNVVLNMPSSLVTSISKETEWTLGRVGSFVGVFNLFSGVCTFFAGPLVDKIGTRKTALCSLSLMIPAAVLSISGGDSFAFHMLGRVIAGAGYGLMYPIPGAIIAEDFPAKKSATLIGIRSTVDFIGCALPFYLMIPIYKYIGSWQACFGFWYFLIVIPLVILFIADREKRGDVVKKNIDIETRGVFKSLSIISRQKWVWLIAAIQMGTLIPFYAFGTYLPSFLELEKGFDVTVASGITGLIQVIGIFAGVFSGKLSEILGKRKILAWGAIIGVLVGILMMLLSQSVALISLGALSFGFAVCMYTVFVSLVPLDILGKEQPALYVASISMVLGVSSILGYFIPYIFQYILDLGMSIRMALAVFSIPTLLAVVPAVMLKETAAKKQSK